MLSVRQFINEPVPSNCFVIYDKDVGTECIIIDPGSRDEKKLFAYLKKGNFIPKYIILTHEHFDHCWGVNQIVDCYHIPVICSAICAEAVKDAKRNCSVFYDNGSSFKVECETITVESIGNVLLFGGAEIRFFSTPGHTDASICFTAGNFLFTGDTLIKGLRTVTKLPNGSVSRLTESIKLLADMQGKGYTVYPGHNESFLLDGYDLSVNCTNNNES